MNVLTPDDTMDSLHQVVVHVRRLPREFRFRGRPRPVGTVRGGPVLFLSPGRLVRPEVAR